MGVVVRENGKWLVTNRESHTDSLHIISFIKYIYEYIFGACKLFGISNISPPSLHPFVMVVILKPAEGKNCRFKRHQYQPDVDIKRVSELSKNPPPPHGFEKSA